jgi:hypothetical protein
MTGQEVEPDCDLGAMHYDPIEEVGVMVIVVKKSVTNLRKNVTSNFAT